MEQQSLVVLCVRSEHPQVLFYSLILAFCLPVRLWMEGGAKPALYL